MRRAALVGLSALLAGCAGGAAMLSVGNKPQAIVQTDLRLPRGTRVAVVPLSLYGFEKKERDGVESTAYSSVSASLLKAGFHVVERSLVEKAVQDYVSKKTYGKVAGAEGAVYQDTGGGDGEQVVDLVEVGRTLNVRLMAAGSMTQESTFLETRTQARLRVTDVTNGEMISHCEASGGLVVMDGCGGAMATELAQHVLGLPSLSTFGGAATH